MVSAFTCFCCFPLFSPDPSYSLFPFSACFLYTPFPLDTPLTFPPACLVVGSCHGSALRPHCPHPASVGPSGANTPSCLPCHRHHPERSPLVSTGTELKQIIFVYPLTECCSPLRAMPIENNPISGGKKARHLNKSITLAVHCWDYCRMPTFLIGNISLASARAVFRHLLFHSKRFCLPSCPVRHFAPQPDILFGARCYFKP